MWVLKRSRSPADLELNTVNIITDIVTADAGTTELVIPTEFETTLVTLVTGCEDFTSEFTLPKGTTVATVVIEGEGITLLTSTSSSDCDITYKFLNHDGTEVEWTSTSTQEPDCCNQPANCTPLPETYSVESSCTSFLLLRANYVDAPAPDSRDKCPCYDCSEESPVEEGGGPLEEPGSGPNPCTIRVQRLNRRWCVNRHCN